MGQLIRSDAYSGIGNFDYDLIRRMKGADGNDILLKSRGSIISLVLRLDGIFGVGKEDLKEHLFKFVLIPITHPMLMVVVRYCGAGTGFESAKAHCQSWHERQSVRRVQGLIS